MRRTSFIVTFIIVSAFALLLTGCRGKDEIKYRIGVSQCSGDYWREKTNEEIRRELLFHNDTEVEIRNADNDSRRQIEDIRYFMDNGFDLIIVSPNESAPLTPIIKEAYNKGIPVVTFDRRIDGETFTSHMEVDNYALGKAVADYGRYLIPGQINVIEIQGPTSASPARLRHEGFTDEIGKIPGVNVVASVYGEWDDGRAGRLTDSLLRQHPETNMIYAHTDHMGIGAARAARKAGRGDIAVMGIDGFPHVGIKAVKDSLLTASFLYPSEGERLLRIAMSILKDEKYDRINRVAPLPPVNLSNADIILAQDSLIAQETSKINLLRDRLDIYWDRYYNQKALLYATIIIIVLLAGILFLLVRTVNSERNHKRELLDKNGQLEDEKMKQERLNERLKEATKSKLMFFTNVSHDLRTPLTLITGPVEEVASKDYLEPADKSLMHIARKNIKILRRLIDQILDFRKYENGKTSLKLTETCLARLIADWTEDFRCIAEQRDIKLETDIDGSCDIESAIDVEKMERVFFNLMSNAFKHTPDNGRISVSCHKDTDAIYFSVKDNGEGMDEDVLGRIFDRFYQVDKPGSRGSGIGLALTKAFIELHGGTITVKSEKGKGSEFTVMLPVVHCENRQEIAGSRFSAEDIEMELASEDKDQFSFDEEKPLMLIIDDNKDIQNMITDMLGNEYNIITASDGRQGLKSAVRNVPDIIICDVMMPVMDGLECVRRIKSEVSTSHIPVLMLTACALDEQRVEGYDSGADGYLSKPFSGKVLDARCRNLLLNRKRIKDLYTSEVKKAPGQENKEKRNTASGKRSGDMENEFYTRFLQIVEENLKNADLSIEDIAGRMGLSQSQFTRKIKALANYTPVEIIRAMRLKKARTLLSGTDKTVSEIAFEVGFTSLAYFSKCYKTEFGEPPSEVRSRK